MFFFHFLSGGVKQTAKLFTFCWFWLGNMHQNGLSGTYLGFEACQIQWCRFWVSTIRGSWKIKISGKNFTFCSFWLEKNASEWLKWHVFRVYPYTMFQNPIPTLPVTNQENPSQLKKYLSHKVLTQFIEINIPKKPICADFWAFLNTFSLYKLIFFCFCQGELSKQPNVSHFVDFDWETCIKMAWVAHI